MRPKRLTFVSAILILLAAATTAVLVTGCAQKTDSLETVRIGGVTQPIAGLVYIAAEKGFFKAAGLTW